MSNKKTRVIVICCIISVIIAIIITYKITNPVLDIPKPNIVEYPVSSSKYLKKERVILNDIVSNFNDEKLKKDYVEDNSLLMAKIDGNTIVVDYQFEGLNEQFIFILDNDTLSISVANDKVTVFDDLFKLMIVANQRRLGNNSNLSEFFATNYKNDNMLNNAIIVSRKDNETEYIINIDKKIK